MSTTSNIRNGAVIFHKNKRMKVIEFQHVKPGKGGAFVRTKLKDIISGKIVDETFNAGHKLEFIRVDAKTMQYLYKDSNFYIFMDNDTFDQINVIDDIVGKKNVFLKEGMKIDLLFDGNEILDVRFPSHVIMEVVETEPGIKGNTATGATKVAKLETGHVLNVPLFINEGDRLRIDTRTGDYVERAKQ